MTTSINVLTQPLPLAPHLCAIAKALADRHAVPTPWPEHLTLGDLSRTEAYAIQAAVASQLGWFSDGPPAWKVGGTTDISAAPLPAVQTSPASWTLHAEQDNVLIEAELAFRLDRPMCAPIDLADALACLGTVCVSVELIGTRLPDGLASSANWKLADQGVHAGLIVGPEVPCQPWLALSDAEWLAQACQIHVRSADGKTTEHDARGSHPATHPLRTLPWLAAHAAAHTGSLRAGDLITTGAWLVASVRRGDTVEVGFERLNPVKLTVE